MSTTSESREMRKMVSHKMCLLAHEDLKTVFKEAQKMVAPEKFITSGDGTRLSLDMSIPDEVVRRLLEAIESKLTYAEPDQRD